MTKSGGVAVPDLGGVRRRTALIFIVATLVIDMLGIGLVWPILPLLIEELTGSGVGDAALIYGVLLSVYAVMQFALGPLIGTISDRFGRRPVLLASLFALGVDYVILALAPSLAWLVAGRVLAGILGETISTANAYVADITPREGRAAAFGLIGAAFGVGFTLGPLLGGVLGEIDLRLPFWFAAGLSFLNVAFGWFALPESLPRDRRRPIALERANPFGALLYMRRYASLITLIAALFLSGIAQQGLQGIWVLWTNVQLGYGVAEAGYSLAWVGVATVFVQGYLVRVVVPRFGERLVILVGYALSSAAFAALPFVTSSAVLYLAILVHICGWGTAGPSLQAAMSQNVPDHEQGLLQGTLSSVNTLTMILGPLLATGIFARTTGTDPIVAMPGAFYLVGAALFVATVALLIAEHRRLAVAPAE